MPDAPLSFADGVSTPFVYERLSRKVWVLGCLILAIGLVAAALMLTEFSSRSYLYLLFYAIPANSAVSVFPHEPVVIYFGRHGSILLTALAASAGTLIAGYLDHSVFVPAMNHRAVGGYKGHGWYRRAASLFMRQPFLALVITGFTPIPFFPFKFLSFSVHYPLWRYLAALLTGRFPRYLLLAWLGRVLDIPTWLLVAIFGTFFAIYGVKAVPQAVRYLRRLRRAEAAPNQEASP
jgi:membrane protein YqaA with SNARE-associated domain